MKKTNFIIITLLLVSLLLSACGKKKDDADLTPTPSQASVTTTPDPCSSENIKAEVEKVHKFMREFDDASLLAASTPRDQVRSAIADLQRIRRDAEDQEVPSCLRDLKTYQIAHMNTVINTLVAFMGGTVDQDTMNQGIALARQQHDKYTLELARLLGVTVVAATPKPTVANGTPAETAPVPTGATVTNPGPNSANLRSTPDIGAASPGVLAVNQTATVFGKSADGAWLQVEIPGQPGSKAWVYATLVQLSVDQSTLPVVTP
jgi:hypothetical protein